MYTNVYKYMIVSNIYSMSRKILSHFPKTKMRIIPVVTFASDEIAIALDISTDFVQ